MDKEYIKGLISVIVPVHNVARYLEQCIYSICEQTYKQLEIIIIEDGSDDGSDAICDSFTDSRIHVIHSTTSHVSAARNVGLDVAKGEFITFVDSDDYLYPTMYEKLIDNFNDSEAVFIACGIEFWDGYKHKIDGNCEYHTYIYDYAKSVEALCNSYMCMVWNKVYRHKEISDIRFEVGVSYEDVGYMRKVFERVEKTIYLDEPLYAYRVLNTSSGSFTKDKNFHEMKMPVLDEYELFIKALIEKKYNKQARLMRGQQLGRIKQIYNQTGKMDKEPRKRLHKMFRDKMFRNYGWTVYVKSFLAFAIIPEISRRKYINKITRIEKEQTDR